MDRLKYIENELVSGASTITKTVVADIHATTSALKSYATTFTADGIEDCRKACGGHGFLVCSGLVELSNTYLQSCTVEGDNQMLPQQVIKVLLKLVEKVQTGDREALKDYEVTDMNYLIGPLTKLAESGSVGAPTKSTFAFTSSTTKDQFLDISILLEAFQHRTTCLLLDVATQLQSTMETSSSQQAWNDCLISMSRASRAHACYLLVRDFYNGLEGERRKTSSSLGKNEIEVLSHCLTLLALYWMDQHLSDFLQIQCIESKHIPHLRSALLEVMTMLRPSAVGLCDARDFSDFRLKSALGRFDGDVYPAIIKAAKNEPLNKQSADGGVGLGYNESLRKLYVKGAGVYHPSAGGAIGVSGTVSRL